MDIDDLRKQFKKRKENASSAKGQSLAEDTSSFSVAEPTNDRLGKADISIAFLANGCFYFCIGETGQKLKIPLSRIGLLPNGVNNSIEQICKEIDSLSLPSVPTNNQSLDIVEFCRANSGLLSNTEFCILMYNDKEGYLKCLRLVKDGIAKNIRICAEGQMAVVGFVALDAQIEVGNDSNIISYRYYDKLVEAEIGDGVIKIRTVTSTKDYSSSAIRDLIKGCILQIATCMGWLRDMVTLDCTSHTLSLLVKENGRVRDAVSAIERETTIPTRTDCNITIESNQTLGVDMEGLTIASDISDVFDTVTTIEIDANNIYTLCGYKDKQAVSIPLQSLIDK